jgi:hypothetical protein
MISCVSVSCSTKVGVSDVPMDDLLVVIPSFQRHVLVYDFGL